MDKRDNDNDINNRKSLRVAKHNPKFCKLKANDDDYDDDCLSYPTTRPLSHLFILDIISGSLFSCNSIQLQSIVQLNSHHLFRDRLFLCLHFDLMSSSPPQVSIVLYDFDHRTTPPNYEDEIHDKIHNDGIHDNGIYDKIDDN